MIVDRMWSMESAATREPSAGNVTHGYLKGPRPLFVSYHRPARQVGRTGYVICPPLAWEGMQSYQSLRVLAEQLAHSGIPALVLNYDGTGESAGSDEDPGRVDAWIQSIHRSIGAMSNVSGIESVGLIGLRIGATFAAKAASETRVATLILWEPILSGAHYTRELEIVASATSAGAASTPRSERKGIEAAGYVLREETVSQLNTLSFTGIQLQGAPDVHIITRDDRPTTWSAGLMASLAQRGSTVSIQALPGYKEMMTYPEKSRPPFSAIEELCAWIVAREQPQGGAPAGTAGTQLPLEEVAVVGNVRSRPVRFGPQQRIFGVLSEPEQQSDAVRQPVLILTGGLIPRTAVNRMYVELARRLADEGHTVLRMDVSGIGESLSPAGKPTDDPHPPWLVEDATCGARALLEFSKHPSISAIGLCSGAYAAFHMARAEPRASRIVLLNPADLALTLGTSGPTQAEQILEAARYRSALRNLSSWRRLLKGQVRVGAAAAFIRARLVTILSRMRDRLRPQASLAHVGVAGQLRSLLDRGLEVFIVFSEGDVGQAVWPSQIGRERNSLLLRGMTEVSFQGADHTFNQFNARDDLMAWVVAILSSDRKPSPSLAC